MQMSIAAAISTALLGLCFGVVALPAGKAEPQKLGDVEVTSIKVVGKDGSTLRLSTSGDGVGLKITSKSGTFDLTAADGHVQVRLVGGKKSRRIDILNSE